MASSREVSYEPRTFTAGELKRALEQLARDLVGPDATLRASVFEELPDGTSHTLHNQPPDVLLKICDLKHQRTSLIVDLGKVAPGIDLISGGSLRAEIRADFDGYLDVKYAASDLAALDGFVSGAEAALDLREAPAPSVRARERARQDLAESGRRPLFEHVEDLEGRVLALERTAARQAELTCFLSFQFTGVSVQYAGEVKAFLQLLDVHVVTGEGYEPKPIVEKVKSRLAEPIDVVVLIEVAERKSSWTRDEIAKAQQPGVLLIPLVEEGGRFDQGIYGDHEYISFAPGHIGDAFRKLLEGIRFVRRARAQPS